MLVAAGGNIVFVGFVVGWVVFEGVFVKNLVLLGVNDGALVLVLVGFALVFSGVGVLVNV